MNRIHRLVWSQHHRQWLAAPEIAKRGRTASKGGEALALAMLAIMGRLGWRQLLRATLGAVALTALLASQAQAQTAPKPATLPQGGQVVAGQAQLQTGGSAAAPVLSVNQASQRAVIDWSSFNLGSAATVDFNQPNAQSATLNRVTGMDPSQIFGHISAPGQVTLINPAGVFFSPSAVLDVGALTATTMQQSDADFMAGIARFQQGGGAGSVVNQGRITAALAGYVALLAPEVRNQGLIVASQGTVALASGSAITLNFDPESRLASLTVTPSQIATLVENGQAVQAPGGLIILSAASLNGLMGSVVNSGTLDASSLSAKGGRILLEGDAIGLGAASKTLATGATGGGTVLAGGGLHGSGGMVQADSVTMAADATVDVSATQTGKGGTAVLWSDTARADSLTTAKGTIVARGGSQGGDGGQIETSGHAVDVSGIRIDAGATQGKAGQWLIDPYDYTIGASQANAIGSALGTSDVLVSTTVNNSAYGSNGNSASAGNILLDANIVKPATGTGTTTLTLQASNRITIQSFTSPQSITTLGGPLNVVLWSGYGGTAAGIHVPSITTNGGDVWIGGSASAGGSSTWDGLTVGNGPAQSNSAGNWNAVDWAGTINTKAASGPSGGDVMIWGKDGATSSNTGLWAYTYAGIQAGSGQVSLISDSYNWNGNSPPINTTGAFTAAPNDTSFTWPVYMSWFILGGATPGGLTLGKAGSTANILFDAAQTVAGPISLYGGNVSVNANMTSTGSGGAVLVQATGGIAQAVNTSVTTAGGNISYLSNANGGTAAGGISIGNGTSFTSGGGNILFAGGTLAGYATGVDLVNGYASNYNNAGIWFGSSDAANINIKSGGGNITARGMENYTAGTNASFPNYGWGLFGGGGLTMDTRDANGQGSGSITLAGQSNGTAPGGSSGMQLSAGGYTTPSTFQTYAGSISLSGSKNAGGSNAWNSVLLSHASLLSNSGNVSIVGDSFGFGAGTTLSTAGALAVTPYASDSFSSAVNFGGSLSGANFVGSSAAAGLTISNLAGLSGFTLGSASNGAATTLGGPFTVAGPISVLAGGSGGTVATTSTLTTTASSGNVTLQAAGNVTVGGTVTSAGSGGISVVSTTNGGIVLNAGLVATAPGAPVLVKGPGDIVSTDNATTFQTHNGNLTFWSDSDAYLGGAIYIGRNNTLNSANGSTAQASGGGRITLAGGTTVDGAGLPTGYAAGSSGSSATTSSGITFGDDVNGADNIAIYSGGGNILFKGASYAGNVSASYVMGIDGRGGMVVNSGAGTIT
ncbi:MAG: filamentous hemagglutinin N-terminal domain-containing protein, partial [Burkholderiales bacterium]|nr:filamentous hemagglutinin N-terminal domain-containing protein [Burkholderiales bacterium]